jgi:hypothetical protein
MPFICPDRIGAKDLLKLCANLFSVEEDFSSLRRLPKVEVVETGVVKWRSVNFTFFRRTSQILRDALAKLFDQSVHLTK